MLDIVYQDEYLVAINKPAGMLVHRTPQARDAKVFALQELRNQLGQYVYPTHRIDRKTSGILVFALSQEVEVIMKKKFQEKEIDKTYWAVVRGFAPDAGTIDKPLEKENGSVQEAKTTYKKLRQVAIDVPVAKYSQTRLSLLEVKPETGRMHQIRRHLAHIRHYIVGDKPHGDHQFNKHFQHKFELQKMLLHAKELNFKHPITDSDVSISANIPEHYQKILILFET